jgi:hypothetical protein
MPRSPSAYEQGTVIACNKADDIATVFTYEKALQEHLEKRLALKPTTNSGSGTLQCRLYNECLQPYN